MSAGGSFIISLDFELMWGVRDHRYISSYGDEIRNVHQVIPQMLELFQEFDICATFSTIGLLFHDSIKELKQFKPEHLPTYHNTKLSPYTEIAGLHEENSEYYIAPKLIEQISKAGQELGTHTYSHFYCLEPGQNALQFEADIKAALAIASSKGYSLRSLVFPRNQLKTEYLEVCKDLGLICYRGTEDHWLYKARNKENETRARRGLRLIDTYINISGYHTYRRSEILSDTLYNVKASRFFRPYSQGLKLLEPLKVRRIKNAMTYAAKTGTCFHLWWHPHNFGRNTEQNLSQLRELLKHFQALQKRYNYRSLSMSQLARELDDKSSVAFS